MTKKIFMITASPSGGGAEKVVERLVDVSFDQDESDITWIVLCGKKSNSGGAFKKKPIVLGHKRAIHAIFGLFRLFLRQKPDVVVSNLTYVTLISLFVTTLIFNKKIRHIAVEHNVIYVPSYRYYTQPWHIRFLAKCSYGLVDAVICVSTGVVSDVTKYYRVTPSRTRVIHNPLPRPNIKNMQCEKDAPIGYIGAHSFQKGVSNLFEAYSHYRNNVKVPRRLCIAGKIPSETEEHYRQILEKHGLAKFVGFAGFQLNPYGFIQDCHLIVVPSRWEGFCNVVGETILCGTKVIAANCHSGPKDIVEIFNQGVLYTEGDVEGLAALLVKNDIDSKRSLPIKNPLEPNLILQEYLDVCNSI